MTDHVRLMRLDPASTLRRHRHAHAYAAVVLSGGYEEAGESGRWRVSAGDVLIHPAFSAHCDRVSRGAARVLDIPIEVVAALRAPLGRVDDPDALVRIAERDPRAAAHALLAELRAVDTTPRDVPDLLAAALSCDSSPLSIAALAAQQGIARETLSRQFRSVFEVSPARYRVEGRARRAWSAIVTTSTPLAAVARAFGFADQAHLTRDVLRMTGRTPGAWRQLSSHSFKTTTQAATKLPR